VVNDSEDFSAPLRFDRNEKLFLMLGMPAIWI